MWIFFLSNLGMGAGPVIAASAPLVFVDPDAAMLVTITSTVTIATGDRLLEGSSGKRRLESGSYRLLEGAGGVIPGSFVDPDLASLIMIIDTTIIETDPDAATLITVVDTTITEADPDAATIIIV